MKVRNYPRSCKFLLGGTFSQPLAVRAGKACRPVLSVVNIMPIPFLRFPEYLPDTDAGIRKDLPDIACLHTGEC